MARMPTLFISHGSPMLAVVDSAARRFLEAARAEAAGADGRRRDFRSLRYSDDRGHGRRRGPRRSTTSAAFPTSFTGCAIPRPAIPSSRATSSRSSTAAGVPARLAPNRGLDHGAWIPLSLMFPRADVPVLQISIGSARSPEQHFALGRALRSLRDAGALVLGLRRRDAQSRAVRARARPRRRQRAARVGRGVQRMDGRRHRGAALRRSVSLRRARAVCGAESPDAPSTTCRCS